MSTDKKPVDWERIENEYRAGLLSVREIAANHGVSHVAIGKRAKRDSWERDLNARIRAKADALVTSATVTREVTAERAVTDRAIIEANAEVIANVRLAHRKDIGRARTLAMDLLNELEIQTTHRELIDKLGEMLSSGDSGISDKMLNAYHAITSLPGRTKTMKDLGDTLHKLIGLEREAYNIGDAKVTPPPAPGSIVLPSDPIEAARLYQKIMAGEA